MSELNKSAKCDDDHSLTEINALELLTGPSLKGVKLRDFSNSYGEICPPFRNVIEQERAAPVSLGCKVLDSYLGGGLPAGCCSLVELSGPSGSGKTQLALQLALAACEGGASGAIYAVCKGRFPAGRCRELAAARIASSGKSNNDTSSVDDLVDQLLSRIIVEEVSSADSLLSWAHWRLPYLLRITQARVVIVDSVAAVYRPEFDDALARAGHLCRMAGALKSALRDCPKADGVCVCINQVSQRFKQSLQTGSLVVPALGSAWSVCVNMRLFLERSSSGPSRVFRILHASHLPSSKTAISVVVDKTGVYAEHVEAS